MGSISFVEARVRDEEGFHYWPDAFLPCHKLTLFFSPCLSVCGMYKSCSEGSISNLYLDAPVMMKWNLTLLLEQGGKNQCSAIAKWRVMLRPYFFWFYFLFVISLLNMSLTEISQALLSHGWFLCSSAVFLTSTYQAFLCMLMEGWSLQTCFSCAREISDEPICIISICIRAALRLNPEPLPVLQSIK